MKKPNIPTWNQASALKRLMDGWELIIGEWCQAAQDCMEKPVKERIYWQRYEPKWKLNPYETIDCGMPTKLKRHYMGHMERYGWVVRSDTGWTITREGRRARKRYDEWWKEVCKKHNWEYK